PETETVADRAAREIVQQVSGWFGVYMGGAWISEMSAIVARAIEESRQWIPVEEKLPEFTKEWKDGRNKFKESDPILVHDSSRGRVVAFYYGSKTWSESSGDKLRHVTHWQSIADPPKG